MSKKLMFRESQFGGMAAQEFQEKQLKAFTKTALKYAGITADSADPENLRKAYESAGKKFGDLAAVTNPKIPVGTQDKLLDVAEQYMQAKGVNTAPIIETLVNRVGTMAGRNGGVLKGDQYRAIITDIRKYAESSSDVELTNALKEFREVLDDAVEQSMGGKTLDAWRKLRAEYRNLIVLTDAVSGGGEMALQGIIDPVALNNAVRTNVGKRNYAKGYGDLNELSRAARLVMPKLPDSGTASRMNPMLSAGLGGSAGATSFFASGGNVGMGLAGAGLTMAGMAAPQIAGQAMLSPLGRRLIAAGGSTVPATVSRGMIPLLMGQ